MSPSNVGWIGNRDISANALGDSTMNTKSVLHAAIAGVIERTVSLPSPEALGCPLTIVWVTLERPMTYAGSQYSLSAIGRAAMHRP